MTMIIEEVMTPDVEYIPTDMSLTDAAKTMRERDCGFLPLGNSPDGRLKGVVTDRDIVIRGVAAGKDPNNTPVDEVKTDKVLYCFREDDVRDAAYSMREKQVYRLIVLDNKENKKLCGIVSLGDILSHPENAELAGDTARSIRSAA